MKHVSIIVFAGLAFILTACGDVPPREIDLAGKWKFRTVGEQDGYIQGSMKVGIDDTGAQTCKITVYMSEFGSAVESCHISQHEGRIGITTEIISNSAGTWRPEVFDLTLVDDKLVGTLTKVTSYSVEFTKRP